MSTFIELLEEIADARPVISVAPADLDHLVERFGDRVRRMGRWNASTDGSLDIPIGAIREAASELGSRALHDALREIKTESSAGGRDSAATLLIDRIGSAYDRQFRALMGHYRAAAGAGEATQLRDQLVREIFGESVPKIHWRSLPTGSKQHLVERLREREITEDDLAALRLWIATDPEVPGGPGG